MSSTVAALRNPANHAQRSLTEEVAATLPAPAEVADTRGETIPTLRELEAKMGAERLLALAKQRQKSSIVVRLLRELGLMKEPGTCHGVTRQAVPCKRPGVYDGYCRLHAPAVRPKKSVWQRLLPISTAKY